MDQMPSNLPVMDEPKPGPAGWFQVWKKAVTKPNELTFIEITTARKQLQKLLLSGSLLQAPFR